jgi:hypothetical protein
MLETGCRTSGFESIVSYFSNERGINERIARFAAVRLLRTTDDPQSGCTGT